MLTRPHTTAGGASDEYELDGEIRGGVGVGDGDERRCHGAWSDVVERLRQALPRRRWNFSRQGADHPTCIRGHGQRQQSSTTEVPQITTR